MTRADPAAAPALSPFILQLWGGKSGAERWGWGLLSWEEGRQGSPGMLSCSLGSLCGEEGSDQTLRSQKGCSGPLGAAGMNRRCEQSEDNKQVGLFVCFKSILL